MFNKTKPFFKGIKMKLKELPEAHQEIIVDALLSYWASRDFNDLIEDADYNSDKISKEEVVDLLTTYQPFIETIGITLEDTLKKALANTEIDL